LVVDGSLSDSSWLKTEWTDWFVDIRGNSMPRPRFRTRAKMLWDDTYLYVGAELQEPDVWATLRERDTVIFRDNDFEVFIDPDGDTHLYYEFEMNAFNTVWDLLLIKPYRDGGPPVNAWNIVGLKSAVQVYGTINRPGDVDTGWTVEIAFPWKVLKECAFKETPPGEGDQWRINFSRVEWRVDTKKDMYSKEIDPRTGKSLPEDNWVWSPQGLVDMHYPELWGFVQFSHANPGNAEVDFVVNPEERAKWILREIYYKQKEYFKSNGHFAYRFGELGIKLECPEGYRWPPEISGFPSYYEASIRSLNGKMQWHIRPDGLTWKN
jgi:hypothetical protein